MRLSRMLFGLPFAGLLLAAALTFLSPTPSTDLSIAAGGMSYQVPEYALVNAIVPADLTLAAEAAIDKPRDAHRHVYVVANRPLAAWRTAADTTFMLIDPHIAI